VGLIACDITFAYAVGSPGMGPAVRSVSVEVARGDLVLLVGTTGSGKSTLLRLLAGLLTPDSGVVEIDGRSSAHMGGGRVGIVFQNPEWQFFAETLLADVMFGPRNLGRPDPRRHAREALQAVGLDPDVYGARSPFSLSGGEARRAAIAGALALGAPYLLLDEPTAGLDRAGHDAVRALLSAERERAGLVVVTHDPEEFLGMASAIVVLDAGEAIFSGSVEELLVVPERYEAAGLRLPDVVRVQLNARERGIGLPDVAFEPCAAARLLLEARGRRL